jgi:hypothetical protein
MAAELFAVSSYLLRILFSGSSTYVASPSPGRRPTLRVGHGSTPPSERKSIGGRLVKLSFSLTPDLHLL